MRTHWIPPYTETIGTRQKAVCGTLIDPRQHTDEPTCEECAAYLLADATATVEDVFGPDYPMPSQDRARREPDPVEEYERQYMRLDRR